MSADYLLSRLPIYGPDIDVAAYEIRSSVPSDPAAGNDKAREDVERTVYSMLTEAGIDEIAGDRPCLVQVTSRAVLDGWWKDIFPGKAVLEYPDLFQSNSEIAAELVKLVEDGGRIALDGRLPRESLELFTGSIHTLILDVTALSPEDLERKFSELKQYNARLLAGRLDTYDDLEYCKSLGFDLYQGRFISRSATREERDVPVNRLSMMRVLSTLQDPNLVISDLEKTISMDAALSYKLLTYANSAAVALPRAVNSIGHAVRMVGLNMLRTWASVLLLSTIDDKPQDLMTIALVRARMCDRLAGYLKGVARESFFAAGLLSVIDALLDSSMEQAIAKLPLTAEVKSALIDRAGPAGQALRCAVAYEQADWDEVQFYGLGEGVIRDIYMDAISWARQITTGLLT